MIEIKIPTSAAVLLLKEKMILEMEALQKAKLIPTGKELHDLSGEQMVNLIETAAFDLIFSLPAEIYVDDSNIAEIISKSIRSFAAMYGIEELRSYTLEDAKKLVIPIRKLFKTFGEKEMFSKN
ncbi:hypothetical protein MNBD_IGNAVI01-1455 [hydrothermal vent metagenome]|uniref:Uncharacterized protein n=1 Tax=hydrothermal vent metagenome TaxID=652676 RepID=A0A3B1CRM0_9ZZZZ